MSQIPPLTVTNCSSPPYNRVCYVTDTTSNSDQLFFSTIQPCLPCHRYYLDDPTRGAIPLVVAEIIAVTHAPPPPKPPFKAPYEWRSPYCMFLEDCPAGCDESYYPKGKGREDFKGLPWLEHYTPCNPVLFNGCTRVSESEAARRRSHDQNLFVLPKAWGEPSGSTNVTLCGRAPGYEKRY